MAIASREDKQQVIEALMRVNSKYAKPFEKGKMASTSFLGGNWEQYAQIVMSMVSADTLLEIDAQLERLNQNIERLATGAESSAETHPPAPDRVASDVGTLPSGPPGNPQWLPDPTGRYERRFWDGSTWTSQTVNGRQLFDDPI
jgi:Protein of unknown function (DUF2510)